MRSALQCVPCALNQALRSIEIATGDIEDPVFREKIRFEGLRLSLKELSNSSLEDSPAEISTRAIRAALSTTQTEDPYGEAKDKHTKLALSLFDKLKSRVRDSEDPLRVSLKLAACGNVIDLGTGDSFDLEREIERTFRSDFARDEYPVFRERLGRAHRILYIADNAGEIVFDRFVFEEIQGKVTVAVKSGPILNDATVEDAISSGLRDTVSLMGTGTAELGVPLERSSREFRESFDNSDLVVAKGQANFETLDEQPREVFFLLKAKCEVVARRLGVEVGDAVFTRMGF